MHPIIKFHKYHAALIESYIRYLAQKDKSVFSSIEKTNTIAYFPCFGCTTSLSCQIRKHPAHSAMHFKVVFSFINNVLKQFLCQEIYYDIWIFLSCILPFDLVSITLIDAHSCVHIYASLVSAQKFIWEQSW